MQHKNGILPLILAATMLVSCAAGISSLTACTVEPPTQIPAVDPPTDPPPSPPPTEIPPTDPSPSPTDLPPSPTPTEMLSPTPIEVPTEVPSPAPTSTPTVEAFTLITSAERIIGTWLQRGASGEYARFDPDGTWRQARTRNGLDSRPFSVHEYWFQDGQLSFKEISVSGVPSCGEAIGTYEIRLHEDGTIQLVAVSDGCRPRRLDTIGVYDPVTSAGS